MPADEFSSWLAYFEIEPWGTYALELALAQIMRLQYATAGAKSVPEVQELMPFVSYRKRLTGAKHKTPEELLEKMRQFSRQV